MQIHAQVFATEAPLNQRYLRRTTPSRTLAFSRKPVGLMVKKKWCPGVPLFVDPQGNLCQFPNKVRRTIVSAIDEGKLGINTRRKRKVVEHISLLRAKEDLSEEQEKDMLDYLYTTQYQMRGIVAISLGRISDQNPEQYTHAIFMRFQAKEDLAKFYKNSFYVGVLKEHVMPYCHGVIDLDYESEVEDDILPIFRKGEDFNYGVELILLVAFIRSSLGGPAEDALTSLTKLTLEFPSLIVQATKGSNIDVSNTEYTHGAVIRFRSSEAFKMFMKSSEYNNWTLLARSLCSKNAGSCTRHCFRLSVSVILRSNQEAGRPASKSHLIMHDQVIYIYFPWLQSANLNGIDVETNYLLE